MKDVIDGPLLGIRGLRRHFTGNAGSAVSDVTLDVGRGEILALLGPSGCGKTTTLRLVAGFDRPDDGRVHLGGRDVTDLPPEARGIGFVFQDYALFPHLSVEQNVRFGLHHLGARAGRARAAELIEMVGLTPEAARMPHQLSGGQQQRVALARALAPEPDLVLMDEPFSNLDATRRVAMRQEVRALLKRIGAAAIVVTHDQEEALALADRIAVMQAGRILQSGTPREVYTRPVSETVARFLGNSNIIEGEAQGTIAETALGPVRLERAARGRVRLSIRPEQIVLSDKVPDAASGVVMGREFRGHDQVYWIRAHGGTDLVALIHGNADYAQGTPIGLSMREPAILLADG
ncbi:ABC transporter ATP-binding protein [Palleronia sp. LCG004]|uniref:ABC transporter ATP-binding protein n=1 Tax=Palleronia sp. LCG004 TaxID=3079304 RepID=UPI002943B955|nr:ABC transporter ATP-binding protein [Palleronia sp. LCG004]WOI57758.1 ABC transporter ATP-binding protein [Palleronia sp. LCG004]